MMPIDLVSAGFGIAVILTAVMGFAIQRGATCTIAAVDEIVGQRRYTRLVSMFDASFWVAGGLLIASVLHLTMLMPAGFPITWMTFAGGVLLGLGAFVNKACVVGAIARLSSGEWAYIATPVGFFVGCAVAQALSIHHAQPAYSSLVFDAAPWAVWIFGALILARLGSAAWRQYRQPSHWVTASIWTPGAATVVIGIAFIAMLLLVGGSWVYTDVLAELSAGKIAGIQWRLLLLLALYAGAFAGGYSAGRWRKASIGGSQILRCFSGGLMMGVGSLLIPGSNDGLILLGIPLLQPRALLAFLTMGVSIAVAMKFKAVFGSRRRI